MDDLAEYLKARVPDGMGYLDAAQLCLRLYCNVDGVPERFLPLSRPVIGAAFTKLARDGWVRDDNGSFHRVLDQGHWNEVIAGIFKKGLQVVDMARGEALARQVGFVRENAP